LARTPIFIRTSPKTIFEGPRGFYHEYCNRANPEDLKRDGMVFEIESVCFKPLACCRFSPAAIGNRCCFGNFFRNSIPLASIQSILIELAERLYNIVG
jgi:2-methylcitrate dehydratase PrpD